MINVDTEKLELLSESGPLWPGKRKPKKTTLYSYIGKGINGIKLESMIVCGRRMTSREAIRRFLAAQNREMATS